MFYYYGRKKRIAHLYPSPSHDLIIEPFAGSAAYSLYGDNWQKDVTICDISLVVVAVWNYLKQASHKDIQSLPRLEMGEKVTDHSYLSEAEKWLIGFHINPGSSVPKITCSRFSRWEAGRKYILENLGKIRHWKVICSSYIELENKEATWFIDPPYADSGVYYPKTTIDYASLSAWCQFRRGQIIVCEEGGASWLPFSHLTVTKNTGNHRCKEVIFQRS